MVKPLRYLRRSCKDLKSTGIRRNLPSMAQIVKPDINLIEKESDVENLEALLKVRIKDLEIQLQLKDAEVEQLETAIQEKGLKRVRSY